MARAILLQLHSDQTAPLLVVVAAVAAVALVVVSLCTSGKHAKVWKQQSGSSPLAPQLKAEEAGGGASRKQLLATLSGIGGKAAAVAKMVLWNRRLRPGCSSDDDDDEKSAAAAAALAVEEEEALWRKTIIMGDKCRPLQFAGHITYDSDGNQLPARTINKGGAADASNSI